MRAMVLYAANTLLQVTDLPEPQIRPDEVLLRTHACAVCRTDLNVVDGELQDPKLPLVPGQVAQSSQRGVRSTAFGWVTGLAFRGSGGPAALAPTA